MSGLFGGGKRGPTPEEKAAQERQTELTEKQEGRVTAQEAEEKRRMSASIRARKTGGTRSLLSPDRENSRMGLSSRLSGMF